MELWGQIRHSLTGSSLASDSDEYVDKFFNSTPPNDEWCMNEQQAALKSFVEVHVKDGRRVALVTSGSATVPLNNEGSMDAVSYGDRGAASAEQFLRAGYAVIFLHRRGSLAPFSRHFQTYIRDNLFMKMIHVQPDGTMILQSDNDAERKKQLAGVLRAAQDTSARLFHFKFTTVQQYLHYLRMASQVLDVVGSRGLILLSASVLDYYVPSATTTIRSSLQHSPPQSPTNDKGKPKKKDYLTLNLIRTPNLVRKIRSTYAPKAFFVTLKSVADKNLMHAAAYRDIERWGVDVVVADSPMLPNEMVLLSEQEEFHVAPLRKMEASSVMSDSGGRHHTDESARSGAFMTSNSSVSSSTLPSFELDSACAAKLVRLHQICTSRRQVLKQSKSLLLLTAKFTMMKENDMLNEDADGNKVHMTTGCECLFMY
jgi:phosphopantothenate-cysteine ligase